MKIDNFIKKVPKRRNMIITPKIGTYIKYQSGKYVYRIEHIRRYEIDIYTVFDLRRNKVIPNYLQTLTTVNFDTLGSMIKLKSLKKFVNKNDIR